MEAAARAALSKAVSPARLQRMEVALRNRTKRVQLVFENVSDPHNSAACLRSAEAFGVQHVHIVQRYARFHLAAPWEEHHHRQHQQQPPHQQQHHHHQRPVVGDGGRRFKSERRDETGGGDGGSNKAGEEEGGAEGRAAADERQQVRLENDMRRQFKRIGDSTSRGASRWLTLHYYSDSKDCVEALRRKNYRLWTSDLRLGRPLPDLPLSPSSTAAAASPPKQPERAHAHNSAVVSPTAGDAPDDAADVFVIGNETRGVSQVFKLAVPPEHMFVIPMVGMVESLNLSVATAVLLQHLRDRGLLRPNLTQQEQEELKLHWLLQELPHGKKILERLGVTLPDF